MNMDSANSAKIMGEGIYSAKDDKDWLKVFTGSEKYIVQDGACMLTYQSSSLVSREKRERVELKPIHCSTLVVGLV